MSGGDSGDAVIVETRRLIRLPLVLLNFRAHLPTSWPITLVHGPAIGADDVPSGVRLIPLPARPLSAHRFDEFHARRVAAQRAGTTARGRKAAQTTPAALAALTHHVRRRWYNTWLKSPEFWSLFSRPHLLLFEADSVLCPQPDVPLAWWLGRFAYVGGPWLPRASQCHVLGDDGTPVARCVGNSGLSLWNRALIEALQTRRLIRSRNTSHQLIDEWATVELQALDQRTRPLDWPEGMRAVPTAAAALAFSVSEPPEFALRPRQDEALPAHVPFGVHGPRNWPAARRTADSRPCPMPHKSEAGRHCRRLLQRCPAVEALLLNASLDGST